MAATPQGGTEVAMDTPTQTIALMEHQAQALLLRTPYPALRSVSCECRGAELILRGRLPSFFLKQMAQSAVARLPGVDRVVNQIEVIAALGKSVRD
jgi:hypothetical protein